MYTVKWYRGCASLPDSRPKQTFHRDSVVVMGKRYHYGKFYRAWDYSSGVRMIDYSKSFDGVVGS